LSERSDAFNEASGRITALETSLEEAEEKNKQYGVQIQTANTKIFEMNVTISEKQKKLSQVN